MSPKKSQSKSRKLTTPTLNLTSTPRKLRGPYKKSNVDITDQIFKLPFEHGWKREFVNRATMTRKNKADVYYYTPDGQKLRSYSEIQKYLSLNKENHLTIQSFTFLKKPMGLKDESKEFTRNAKWQWQRRSKGNSSNGVPVQLEQIPTPLEPLTDYELSDIEYKKALMTMKKGKRSRSRSTENEIYYERTNIDKKEDMEDSVEMNVKTCIELTTPTLNLTSTPRKLRGPYKKSNVDITDQIFKLPFEHGWKREFVNRATMTRKNKADVYYYTPDGQKLRSYSEIQKYLSLNKENHLTIQSFTFLKKPMGLKDESKEFTRNAKWQWQRRSKGNSSNCVPVQLEQIPTPLEPSTDYELSDIEYKKALMTMKKGKRSRSRSTENEIYNERTNIDKKEDMEDSVEMNVKTCIELTTMLEDIEELTKLIIHCPANIVNTIFSIQKLSQLEKLNIFSKKNLDVSADDKKYQNEILTLKLYDVNELQHLTELKITCDSGFKLICVPLFHSLVNLKTLSITSVSEFPTNIYRSLKSVTTNLECLEIGDCFGLSKDFGVVLKRFTNLTSLILWNCKKSESEQFEQELFSSIRCLLKLKTLKLFNIEFTYYVEDELKRCDGIETLVITPMLVSNPHTTLRRLFDCLKKLSNTLCHLILGFTSDWFKDTDSMITDFKQGHGGYKLDLSHAETTDNIPMSRIRKIKQPKDGSVSNMDKEDQSNIIDIFSVPALKDLLATAMEISSVRVFKVLE